MAKYRESDTLDLTEVQEACRDVPYRDPFSEEPPKVRRDFWDDMEDDFEKKVYAEPIPVSGRNLYTRKPKKQKKHIHIPFKTILIVLAVLVCLAALAIAAVFLYAKAPQRDTEGLGKRNAGTVNILLAGRDKDGTRTDTIMLASLHKKEGNMTLVSVPRDSLVENVYESQRINSVYGYHNCGEEGCEALMAELTEILGISPDGYVIVDLNAFIALVDLMGGVDFNVPQDMFYYDPTQDLTIDLKAGMQHLDGEHAMELVRFRSYEMADLQRVSVQRDFLSAAIDQWLTLRGICKAPQILDLMEQSIETDLGKREMLWLAITLKKCMENGLESATLPGEAGWYGGASYYILDRTGINDTVNTVLNPYAEPVSSEKHILKTY